MSDTHLDAVEDAAASEDGVRSFQAGIGPAAVSLVRELEEGRARFDPHTGEPYVTTSWAAIDLAPYVSGERHLEPPKFLARNDGKKLVYAGLPHVFFGPSESLKTWAALLAAKSFLDEAHTVLYIDFEGNEMSFVERALHVGIPPHALGRSLRYIRPTEPLLRKERDGSSVAIPNPLADLRFEEAQLSPSLVVVDGVTECYSLHGWNINAAEDAAQFQKLFRGFAEGTASIAIDHAGKDASRGVVGSQHKRAGLDGAEFEFTPVTRQGRGGHSVASIKVTKDRHGFVREFAPHGEVGRIHVTQEGVRIDAPSYAETFGHDAIVVDALLDFIRTHPGSTTKTVKAAVTGVGERAKLDALASLRADGKIRSESGARNAKLWFAADPEQVTD